jgi:hypothetical protein
MKKVLILGLALASITCNAQRKNKAFDLRYFYHWESVNPQQNIMEIIIHKEKGYTKVTEIKFNSVGRFGEAIVYSTVYVCRNRKGRMAVETIDPSTLQIIDSEYILTPDKKLLRVTQNDTIIFKRRH